MEVEKLPELALECRRVIAVDVAVAVAGGIVGVYSVLGFEEESEEEVEEAGEEEDYGEDDYG